MDDYDVIIIGTGAGGGTLARHLAPSGKRILLLERGDWLPREPQNWLAAVDVFVENRYVSPDTWYDTDGKPFQPQIHYFVGGATKLYGAALYRLRAGGLRRASPPRRHLAGLADLLRRARAVLHAGRAALPGARRARRGSDRAAGRARRTRSRPCRTSRGSSSSPTSSRRRATTPSTPPAGSCSTRRTCPTAPACAAPTATASPASVHAKSDAEVLGVRPALEHPNVTLLTNAKAVKLETNAAGTAVTEVVVERDGADRAVRRRPRRRRLRCGEHRQAAALSANDKHPNGLANGSDQVGPQLHVPRQHGRARALARGEPDRLPEDARAERLLLRQRRLRVSAREHPDGRQVAGADVPRREAGRDEARARVDAGADGAARDRLLALDRGPAAAREPGHRRPRRQAHAEPTRRRTRMPKKQLYDKLKSMLGKLDMNPDHLFHRFAYMKNEIPVAGVRPPGGHVPVRNRPGDVGARRQLQGTRARQPVRRRHERLPEHRRGEPGADGDGELAARRRPPARADGVTRRPNVPVAPSGEQIEIAFGDQRAVVVEVGGGLRSYSVGGRELLDGYGADEMAHVGPRPGAHPVAEPAPGRELRVRRAAPPAPAHRARARERDPRPRALGARGPSASASPIAS